MSAHGPSTGAKEAEIKEAGKPRRGAVDAFAIHDRNLQAAAACIAILAVLIRIWVSWCTHSLGEDALITLRYAENIAAGRGWVYNPGERVLGTTTPLFTLILAVAAWLRLPAMPFGIGCNIVADGVTCCLIARLMARREIGCPVPGLFAAMLYAVSSTPISVSISGMETGLVACASMAAIYAYVAGSARALCIAGALLFLLRIDGMLLFALLLIGLMVRRRGIPWSDLGLFAVIAAPWLVFATFYFGSPVPASVTAKLTVYSHTAWTPGSFTNTFAFNHEAFRNQFILGWPQRISTLLFLMGACTIATHALRQRRMANLDSHPREVHQAPAARVDLLGVPLLWLLLYYGTMYTSRVPAFPWYFLPPWPLFVVVTLLGAATFLKEAFQRMEQACTLYQVRPIWWISALVVFAAFGVYHVKSIARDISAAQAREDTLRRPLGLWLRMHVGVGERVLLEPIGYAGYYSGKRILDMVGLVSPEVLPYYHTPHALSGIVNGLHPEWLCLRRSERDLLHEQDPSLPKSAYDLVQPFPSASDAAFYLYHRKRANRYSSD